MSVCIVWKCRLRPFCITTLQPSNDCGNMCSVGDVAHGKEEEKEEGEGGGKV